MSPNKDDELPEAASSLEDDSLLRKIAHVSESDAPPPAAVGALPSTIEVPGLPHGQSGEVERQATELPRVGSVIDQRYRVESVLGEGGMGVVYAARNLRTGRDVALKLMVNRDRFDRAHQPMRVERFVR